MENNIGEMIKTLRKQQGVTQDELANYLNISNQSVSKWETGQANPDITFVPRLAEFFKVSIDTLFNCKATMPNSEYGEKLSAKKEILLSDDTDSLVDMWEGLHMQYPNDCRVEKELIIALCDKNDMDLFGKIFYHIIRLIRTNQNHDIEDQALDALKGYLQHFIKPAQPNAAVTAPAITINQGCLSQPQIDTVRLKYPTQNKPPSGKNVLIVDDAAIMRMMLRKLLEHTGFTIIGEGVNGRQGVDLAKTLCPDIVIMDIIMPEMDGLEAAKKILKNSPVLPIIMLSAMCSMENVKRAFKMGAARFVAKPFQNNTIIQNMEGLYENIE